jgi:tRNA U34 5-methylaminomethyl-2-thiouridine-forming methyltransferase MnmC
VTVADPLPITTGDGSHTLFEPNVGEHYHSTFGAIQESQHVFIETGLNFLPTGNGPIEILEVGFGTGLNALLTSIWSEDKQTKINYTAVEPYPPSSALLNQLNYPDILGVSQELFGKLHEPAGSSKSICPYFTLKKYSCKLQECKLPKDQFDLVYFDAFSPDAQPELWSEAVFRQIAHSMKTGSIFTTYSSKGVVKRALRNAGFELTKIAGPPGKREILRARKERIT